MYSGINASSGSRRSVRRRPVPKYIPQPTPENTVPADLSRTGRLINCCRVLYHCIRRVIFGVSDGYDEGYDEFDVQIIHYKPSNLDDLCQKTKFSREEIKLIYRGFKQECPAGVVDMEQFKELYSQFYPLGDAGPYANYVFSTFDQDEDGHVTFDQFITGMSLLARGTMQQKLRWVFNLYDLNGTGHVTRNNLRDIVSSVYQMLGTQSTPSFDDDVIRDHVQIMFDKLDLNHDGVISLPEFISACQKDPQISRSMGIFDTVL